MFRVGQKVVCIEASTGEFVYQGAVEPTVGDIGTVTNVYVAFNGDLAIELAEFPAPGGRWGGAIYEPGWLACSFRHLVERKTDIGFAHETLRKVSRKVPALANSSGDRQ